MTAIPPAYAGMATLTLALSQKGEGTKPRLSRPLPPSGEGAAKRRVRVAPSFPRRRESSRRDSAKTGRPAPRPLCIPRGLVIPAKAGTYWLQGEPISLAYGKPTQVPGFPPMRE